MPRRKDSTPATAMRIKEMIVTVRGERVILDHDLAQLYGVATKALNQAVRRNPGRFPPDFMFQLTSQEVAGLKSQIVTSNTAPGRSQLATGSRGGRWHPGCDAGRWLRPSSQGPRLCRTPSRRYGLGAASVRTSTRRPRRSSTSSLKAIRSSRSRSGARSTSRSRSLAALASPRTRDPNTRTRTTPCAAARRRISVDCCVRSIGAIAHP